MNAHHFDPVSAILGLIAVAAGAVVMSGVVDPTDGVDHAGLWVTLLALVVGVLLLPWGARSLRRDATGDGISPDELPSEEPLND